MKVIRIKPKHYEDVRMLRNNPASKRGFIIQSDISKEQQIRYMRKNRNGYFVCLDKGTFVGYIGVVNNDIRICVSPLFQGRGAAKAMIRKIKKLYPQAQAKILVSNAKSLNLFMKMGYKIKYYLLEL